MLIRTLAIHGFKSLMQEQPIELGRVNCFIVTVHQPPVDSQI